MALLPARPAATDISPDGMISGVQQTIADAPVQDQQQVADNVNDADQTQQPAQDDSGAEEAFSFNDFKTLKDVGVSPAAATKVSTEEKPVVEPDEVEGKNSDSNEDLDKPQQKPQKPAKVDKTDNRDFTGIEPELIPHFKRMGNEAYNTIKPLIIAQREEIRKRDTEIANLKQGKVVVPDSYYEHENAYMLTPEFSTAAKHATDAQTIYNHWMGQLNSIRDGAKTFKTLTTDAQGNLAYGADMPADAGAETKLMSLFNSAHNQLMTYQGKLGAVQESYKGNYQSAKQWADETSSKTFSAFNDDKSEFAIAAKEYVNKTLPPAFRANPLAPLFARSMVTTAKLFTMLQEAKTMIERGGKGGTVSRQQQQKATKQQPTDSDINDAGGGGNGGQVVQEVTMNDFRKVKEV